MNIIRYRPKSILETFQNDLNALLHNLPSANLTEVDKWAPHIDIKTHDDKYQIYADIPGVDPKDIHVTIEGNILTIEAERKSESKNEREGYTHTERFNGTYYRQFTLPENIASGDITAKCENGVLNLTLPKQTKQKESVIKISVQSPKTE